MSYCSQKTGSWPSHKYEMKHMEGGGMPRMDSQHFIISLQVSIVILNGFLDAQKHGGQPLVQTRD